MIYEFEKKVLEFAKQAHGDQKRKYIGEPYLNHCIEVAEIVKTIDHTEEMVYAAYLHDTIEDTALEREKIVNSLYSFGLNIVSAGIVGDYVLSLTDISKPGDGNRAKRKEMDRSYLAGVGSRVKTIKLADIISNTKDILKNDKKFAKTYIPEKIELLKVLKDGDFNLYMQACYEVYKAKLEFHIYELKGEGFSFEIENLKQHGFIMADRGHWIKTEQIAMPNGRNFYHFVEGPYKSNKYCLFWSTEKFGKQWPLLRDCEIKAMDFALNIFKSFGIIK